MNPVLGSSRNVRKLRLSSISFVRCIGKGVKCLNCTLIFLSSVRHTYIFAQPNRDQRALRHGSSPADEDPAHHEEDLPPAVHMHWLIGVGRAVVLHGVVTPLARPENSLLPQDNEDGPGQRQTQGSPTPVRADDKCKGEEELECDSIHLLTAYHTT